MRIPRPLAAAVPVAVALMLAPTAGAAATTTVALWQMDEPADVGVLVDASGNGLDGTIGSEVEHPVAVLGATAHRFGYLAPNTPPAHPGHLDTVPDAALLDPGTADYAITMRARWTRNFGNMIQKGQSGQPGGYWKWEAPSGIVKCMFRGSAGQKTATAKRPVNDGQWHVIRCERTASGVTMTIDGAPQYRASGPTGSISNTRALTIAGKGSCDQIRVTCDYWVGDIDYVRIERS